MSEAQRDSYFPPRKVKKQAVDYETTDAFADVPGSHIPAEGMNRIDLTIKNTDGANAIDVQLVGRHVDDKGNAGAWVVVDSSAALAAGAEDQLAAAAPLVFDDYILQAKSSVAATPGDLQFFGGGKQQQ